MTRVRWRPNRPGTKGTIGLKVCTITTLLGPTARESASNGRSGAVVIDRERGKRYFLHGWDFDETVALGAPSFRIVSVRAHPRFASGRPSGFHFPRRDGTSCRQEPAFGSSDVAFTHHFGPAIYPGSVTRSRPGDGASCSFAQSAFPALASLHADLLTLSPLALSPFL